MIPCICINNGNCPIDFPFSSKWLEKDHTYHILQIDYVPKSKTIGFKLLEMDNPRFFPYIYFRSDRFVIPAEHEADLIAMLEGAYTPPETVKEITRKLIPQEV